MDHTPIELSKPQAQQIILSHFAALSNSANTAVQQAVRNSGYIQIDTISVIQRAHHHVLYNRVMNYQPADLDKAVEDRQVFEYWAHAAAYLPMENYRYCLPRMQRIRKQGHEWFQANRGIVEHVLNRITSEGPLMARDFADSREQPGQWWDWKPAKIALEELLHQGVLMVKERKSFQKVFDLTERVLPDTISTTPPTDREMAVYLIELTLKNQGISRLPYLTSQHKDGRTLVEQTLAEEVEQGSLLPVNLDGEPGWYMRPDLLNHPSSRPEKPETWIRILSPFDNLIIQRGWVERIFDFPYRLECYLPRPKRRFGYFCLPILSSRGFLGMLDLKADRQTNTLLVQAEHLNEIFSSQGDYNAILEQELQRFARFNGCDRVVGQNEGP